MYYWVDTPYGRIRKIDPASEAQLAEVNRIEHLLLKIKTMSGMSSAVKSEQR